MIGRVALLACTVLLAGPAFGLEPEQREVIVAHNRVWDGYVYQENFVPSDVDELLLLSGADNAVAFVRTQEYYWPLARQTYVAFEKQREEIDGTLVIRDYSDGVVAEVPRQLYSMVYPEGVVNGHGRLVWGDEAEAAYDAFKAEERAFIEEFTAARQAQSAYERALLEAAAARRAGAPVQEVAPPPEEPKPLLKLVTEPQHGYRVALPAGTYAAVLEANGADIPGTELTLRVIDNAAGDVLTAEVVPEERWTRPIQANTAADRIYARPGTEFFVTVQQASRFDAAEYQRLVRPQAAVAPKGPIWVRRRAAEPEAMQIAWAGDEASPPARPSDLKVDQTQGASFGYRVRQADAGEAPDLTAFTVSVPEAGAEISGRLTIVAEEGELTREVVVVRPRQTGLAWLLACVPALLGCGIAVFRRRAPG